MMLASELIESPSAFITGTLAVNARGLPCGTAQDSGAVRFDCLGALLFAYENADARRPIAKRVFARCEAVHGHKHLGRLDHPEALSLLRGAGA